VRYVTYIDPFSNNSYCDVGPRLIPRDSSPLFALSTVFLVFLACSSYIGRCPSRQNRPPLCSPTFGTGEEIIVLYRSCLKYSWTIAQQVQVAFSTTMSSARLRIPIGNTTKVALTIPLDVCRSYAVNPLKWLQFLGYAICGQKGYLSRSNAGPEVVDYTVDIEPRFYYFLLQGKLDCGTLKSLLMLLCIFR
jgi:hypothetical protein